MEAETIDPIQFRPPSGTPYPSDAAASDELARWLYERSSASWMDIAKIYS